MDLIFTDLDGTLLDRENYSWEAASPALDRLKSLGIPWVIVTSKTRAEVEFWRKKLDCHHPFIVENGGAAYIPAGYFPQGVRGSTQRDGDHVVEWGVPYQRLVADLEDASRATGCRVRGFHDMTAAEVAGLCDLPIEQAALAKQREYDEPFVVLDHEKAEALSSAIGERGRYATQGGRFWHILGPNDKASAVRALSALFAKAHGPVRTIGLGDGLNDVSFLNVVAVPVIVRSAQSSQMKAVVPHGEVTEQAGPAGWNDAVLRLIGTRDGL